MKKESSGGGERERVWIRFMSPHHEFLVLKMLLKMLSSDTMIILLVYLQNQEMQYLDLQYLDIFHSNATYVKGLQEK